MKNADSQVILYAKNWFKKTDTIEDLRKIYAKRNLMVLEHISDEDIYSMLTHLVFDLCIKDNDINFNHLMSEIFRSEMQWHRFTNVTRIRNVIRVYLQMLRLLKVKEASGNTITKVLIPLDEPDYTILPRKVDPK